MSIDAHKQTSVTFVLPGPRRFVYEVDDESLRLWHRLALIR